MNALLSAGESIGIFLAGLVVRFGILALVLVLLAVIFLVGWGIVRLARAIRGRIVGLSAADGVMWKRNGYYAPGHTWLAPVAPTTLRFGFDDIAQRVLGHVTSIGLPRAGSSVAEGQPLVEVVCGERRAVIPSPIAGTVVAANDIVALDPGLVHRDPYRRGWLLTLQPATSAYTRFMWGDRARTWLQEEAVRLRRSLEQELQLHAADGGELMAPGHVLLEQEQWKALVKDFLKAE